MQIVIVGAGEVGRSVARTLSGKGHNIYLVEKDEASAKSADDELDVQVVRGNGARPHVLAQAGVTQSGNTDMLIACTNRDEVNMLSCWIAKKAGVPKVISRARNLEFTDSPYWGRELGIDVMLSPERSIAREITGLLAVSSATHTAELLDGRASLYALKVSEKSPLVNMALKDIRNSFPRLAAVFVHVEHKNGVSGVPNGFTVLQAEDMCYIVTYRETAWMLQEIFDPSPVKSRTPRKIFVVGGGKLGSQITQSIKRNFGNVSLRLIEKDPERCKHLSEEIGEALVINGDGADSRLLLEEGIDGADGYICATDSDELNLIYSSIAHELGARKTIAIVKRKDYQKLTECMPVDVIVDPNDALASVIIRVADYSGHIKALTMIKQINAEMLEIKISHENELVGKTLAQIRLQKGIIFALLGRDDKVLIPSGSDQILAGDHVILFYLDELKAEVDKLFAAELKDDTESNNENQDSN